MKTSPVSNPEPQTTPRPARTYSEFKFPVYDLASSLGVAETVHNKAGGTVREDQLAALLGYNSTQNGAFQSRVAAARTFQLISREGSAFKITPLAQKILMPIDKTQVEEGLIEAFFAVPLFKAVYDAYYGKELPTEFGLKNALRLQFNVVPKRVDIAHRVLMDSAEQAGLFKTRGSRTQLIIPTMAPAPVSIDKDQGDERKGPPEGPPSPPKSREELRNEYVGTLIALLREKGKNGEIDSGLMERIEKLLELDHGT